MRRKTYVGAILAAITILSCSPFAFAETGVVSEADSAAAETNAPVQLSLEEAVQIMQTQGTRAQAAQINKQSDEAIAAGYAETLDTIKATLDQLDTMQKFLNTPYAGALGITHQIYLNNSAVAQEAGATGINEKIMRLRRNFAKEQKENNYKAELNQIEYTTVQLYYGVLLAQENVRIAKDNVKVQEDILRDTEAQYKVGMNAKKDVLASKASLESARSEYQASETKLKNAKMSFNFLLDYPVLQEVIFTDSLQEVENLETSFENDIQSAIENRNEIKGATFAKEIHEILLLNLKYQYPQNSAMYLNQKVIYLNAAKTAKDAPKQIEIDIRNRRAELNDLRVAVESAHITKIYAEEGYRLTKLSYEAGMCTLAELQQMQVTAYKANLGVSAATTNYHLALYDYRYATGVGTSRLPL